MTDYKPKKIGTKTVMYDGVPVEVDVYESILCEVQSNKVRCKTKPVFDKNAKHQRQK